MSRSALTLLILSLPLLSATPDSVKPTQPGQLATDPASSSGSLPAPFKSLSEKEKFSYTLLNLVALRGIAGAAIGAGFEEVANTPKEWHRNAEGYGLRAASTFGGALTRQTLNLAFMSALHEDPRYFPLDHGSKYARFWSAIKQTFVARTDSGKATFAYGSVASAFATGQIVGLWQPPSNNSATDGVERGFIGLGVDAGVNLLYEFFPKTRPKEIVSQP